MVKENVEYDVLIAAIQVNIQNLVIDNKRLTKIKDRVEDGIEKQKEVKLDVRRQGKIELSEVRVLKAESKRDCEIVKHKKADQHLSYSKSPIIF